MANANADAWAELQMAQSAEGGTGQLTPAQEADLNREQRDVCHRVNGKQYLYGLQLAAQQRLNVLADQTLVPKAIQFCPFLVISLMRAIEFVSQAQYIALHRNLQDEVNGPADPNELARLDPTHILTLKEVCAVWFKAFGEVTKNNNLAQVNQIPAETAYQRAMLIALTISLKAKFRDLIFFEKAMKKNNSLLMAQMQLHTPATAPAAQPNYGPTKGGQGGPNRRNGGGGKQAGKGKGGGKPAGAGKGPNEHTCLEWLQGRCPGTSKATCPRGHWHCCTMQRATWLNDRFLDGSLTNEHLVLKCQEVDNSPA